ncbi:MAG TPA: hypothetical protein VGL77_14725 [Armatimonadota bacterium]|jgi:hypothetical protein
MALLDDKAILSIANRLLREQMPDCLLKNPQEAYLRDRAAIIHLMPDAPDLPEKEREALVLRQQLLARRRVTPEGIVSWDLTHMPDIVFAKLKAPVQRALNCRQDIGWQDGGWETVVSREYDRLWYETLCLCPASPASDEGEKEALITYRGSRHHLVCALWDSYHFRSIDPSRGCSLPRDTDRSPTTVNLLSAIKYAVEQSTPAITEAEEWSQEMTPFADGVEAYVLSIIELLEMLQKVEFPDVGGYYGGPYTWSLRGDDALQSMLPKCLNTEATKAKIVGQVEHVRKLIDVAATAMYFCHPETDAESETASDSSEAVVTQDIAKLQDAEDSAEIRITEEWLDNWPAAAQEYQALGDLYDLLALFIPPQDVAE